MTDPETLRDPSYERFMTLVNAPALFNALATGVEVGVFDHLSRHPRSSFADLATATDLGSHQLRVLLFGLGAAGAIERSDGAYSNAPFAEQLLASDAEDSWSHIVVGWKRIYYPAFFHLTEALRTGTNVALADHPGEEPTLYGRLAHEPELEAVLHRSMAAFTLQSMSGLLDNVDVTSARTLLDVGGGDGTTARALAERFPQLEVTVFDQPSVVAIGADLPEELAERVTLHGGDLLADPFPTGMDVVVCSHLLEVFDEDRIKQILAKAHAVLRPGGTIYIYGFNADHDETGGMFGARLALYLNVLATGSGMAYRAEDYEHWLTNVGFEAVHTVDGLPFEHGLSIGTRPNDA